MDRNVNNGILWEDDDRDFKYELLRWTGRREEIKMISEAGNGKIETIGDSVEGSGVC